MKKEKQTTYTHVSHTFGPVFDKNSEILILGSFPSVKSREQNFYYGHSQNRFWKVMSWIFNEELPQTIDEKRTFLLNNHIAVWDTIESCDIIGSSDSSICNVSVNDINTVICKSSVKAVFANGGKAYSLFQKFCKINADIPIIKLPSTSPANAAVSLEQLREIWKNAIEEIIELRNH